MVQVYCLYHGFTTCSSGRKQSLRDTRTVNMSQKGSKENIAESNPLLEDDGAEKNGETPEKEEVEVEEVAE